MGINVEEKIEEIETKVNEHSLAYELLKELRQSCKSLRKILIIILSLWGLTIASFLLYLNQFDTISTNTYEASGVYALIDSEGNVIAQDVSEEEWNKFIEWWKIYGESKSNEIKN